MSSASKLESIKQQVEFYFSDANLRRDKFLKQQMENDRGYVQLSTLLTFNRLRQMTSDSNDVRDAVKSSKIVLISDDQRKIKRKLEPNLTDSSVDSRTAYLENIEPNATIETLRDKLKRYGEVIMVHIPRFKDKERSNKGFCFVEFSKEESVKSLCSEYGVRHYDPESGDKKLIAMTKSEWEDNHRMGKVRRVTGLVAKLEDIGSGVTKTEIYDVLDNIKKLRYLDFKEGDNMGYARFASPADCKTVVDYITKKQLRLGHHQIRASILKGEPEKTYLELNAKRMAERKARGAGRGRGRGGRGRGRGRGGRGGGFRGRGGFGGGYGGGGDNDRFGGGDKRSSFDDRWSGGGSGGGGDRWSDERDNKRQRY